MQSLKYVAYDRYNCRHPEQAYGCDFLDGFNSPGYYRIGLRLFHSPDYSRNSVMTPSMLRKRIHAHRRQNPEARLQDVFLHHGQSLYPRRNAPMSSLTVSFDADLLSSARPQFGGVNVVQSDAVMPLPVAFQVLDAQKKERQISPAIDRFSGDYHEMCLHLGKRDRYKPRKPLVLDKDETGFARDYMFGVTQLAQAAIPQHFADEGADVSFMTYDSLSGSYAALTAQQMKENGSGISITAPHRRFVDSINMAQLLSVYKDPEAPCYTPDTLQEMAKVLDDEEMTLRMQVMRTYRNLRSQAASLGSIGYALAHKFQLG